MVLCSGECKENADCLPPSSCYCFGGECVSSENYDKDHPERDVFCFPIGKTHEGTWYLPEKSLLGSGGAATVHEVCNHNADCDYVMKINKLGALRGVTRERFWNEVELQKKAAQLGVSPHVIEAWDCTNPFIGVIIMPALQDTLFNVSHNLQKKRMRDKTRRSYFEEALEILEILKKNQICHGDPHFSNFMIDKAGKLKIIDFGMARVVDKETAQKCFEQYKQTVMMWAQIHFRSSSESQRRGEGRKFLSRLFRRFQKK